MMGEMTQEEINVSLFDELKEARKTIEQLSLPIKVKRRKRIVISNLKRGIATHEQQVQAADRIKQLEAELKQACCDRDSFARQIAADVRSTIRESLEKDDG